MPPLIRLDEPRPRPALPPQTFALFALGFRPFYLLAAVLAALSVPLWLAHYAGWLNPPAGVIALYWHAHEMLFGFASAVVVGFLFTAGRNWTGLPTPRDATLAALAALWLAGRIALYHAPSLLTLVVDVSFLPLAAAALGQVLWRASSRRNYFTVLILLALAGCNLLFHLRAGGHLPGNPLQALHGALALISVLATVIGGRVIPSFTANALRGVKQWKHPRLDQAAISLTVLALLALVLELPGALTAALCALACLAQAARSIGWNPWATRAVPLLWILHLAHLWLPLSLALAAAAALGLVTASLVWHALGVGLIGGLILGMITRTTLGHTGRLLRAGRIESLAYTLVQSAVLLRVVLVLALPGWSLLWLTLAMLCWSGAFALYVWKYGPYLWRSRVDGQAG